MTLPEMANYIEDDWGDNDLTNRTGFDEGYFLHPSDGLLSGDVEAGDALKGVYRPEWNVVAGSTSATNQELLVQNGGGDTSQQIVATPSELTSGSWQFDFFYSTNPSSFSARFFVLAQTISSFSSGAPSDCYFLNFINSGGVNLFESTSGTFTEVISSSVNTNTTTRSTVELTRDSYGGFEVIVDGSSNGTATDTTHTEESYVGSGNPSNADFVIDNLVIQ